MSAPIILRPRSGFKGSQLNFALLQAVENGEVKKIIMLLDRGANANYLVKCRRDFSMKGKWINIITALVQKGATLDATCLRQLFGPRNNQFANNLISCITSYALKHCSLDINYTQTMFYELAMSEFEDNKNECLKHLLKAGLPINALIKNDKTPLHLSIINDKLEFVYELLEGGAKVNKKTADGLSSLHLAVVSREDSVPEMFSRKNAKGPKKSEKSAKKCDHPEKTMVQLLLEKGADINAMDMDGLTPLRTSECNNCDLQKVLIKELARRKYENEKICRENCLCIKENKQFQALLIECLKELESMNRFEFNNGYTLLDIYNVRHDFDAVAFFMKGQTDIDFEKLDFPERYKNYGSELENLLICLP